MQQRSDPNNSIGDGDHTIEMDMSIVDKFDDLQRNLEDKSKQNIDLKSELRMKSEQSSNAVGMYKKQIDLLKATRVSVQQKLKEHTRKIT